ncbi:hypothetical protein ACOSP7_018037 [Xanthoceras sorbifolium]
MASIQERNITPCKQLKTEGEDSNNKNSGSFVTASNANNGVGKAWPESAEVSEVIPGNKQPTEVREVNTENHRSHVKIFNATGAKNSNQNLAFSGSTPLTNKPGSFY